jgi:hypothetical protein
LSKNGKHNGNIGKLALLMLGMKWLLEARDSVQNQAKSYRYSGTPKNFSGTLEQKGTKKA